MGKNNLTIIGSTALVSVGKRENIPAKIDTGADSSSIWASHIRVDKDGILKFRLFDETSPFYNGKVIKRRFYKVAVVRSATGQEQIRYRAYLPLKIGDRKVRALFNLSERSNNNFPVLIGRRTISGKFLVDVLKTDVKRPPKNARTAPLNRELAKNPYEFYKKYSKKSAKLSAKNLAKSSAADFVMKKEMAL